MVRKDTYKKPKFKKSKDREKISSQDIASFKPTHMKFNFSFMTTNNDFSFDNPEFTPEHQAQLLKRIRELSKEDYVIVANRKKNIGIEFIEKASFRKNVDYGKKFDESQFRKNSNDKYAIFRLYTNNNPLPARIIGKIVNNIFYLMYIDLKHGMYDG